MKKIPPLKSLPAFLAVVKTLSFSKAAEQLHVTHSAVSQSIRTLEHFLGQQLFDRSNRQVSVTPQGKKYYYEINTAFNIIEEATQEQLGSKNANILTINTSSTLAMRWLISRLPKFYSLYPNTDLRISTLGSNEFSFERDSIDIAIAYGNENDWPECVIKKILDDQLVLVGPSHLFKKPVDISKILKSYRSIYVNAELRRLDWKDWCKRAEVPEPKKENRTYFQSSSQGLQAVLSGIGVMVTHLPFIIDDLRSDQLKLVSKIQLPMKNSYYLLYPKHKANTQGIINFSNWISEEVNI